MTPSNPPRGTRPTRLVRRAGSLVVALSVVGGVACARGAAVGSEAAWCRIDRTPAAPAPWAEAFFAGEGTARLAREIPVVIGEGVGKPALVRSLRRAPLEDELRRTAPTLLGRDTGAFFVHAASVRVAATPERVAAVLLDVEAEKAALSADEAALVSESASAQGRRRVTRVGLLDMGQKPFTYDFRWSFATTSRRLDDGTVVVRYDLLRDAAPERVSVFAGVAVVESQPGGARWTELFAVGSPVRPPFFLRSKVRSSVEDILTKRVQRLAARMESR